MAKRTLILLILLAKVITACAQHKLTGRYDTRTFPCSTILHFINDSIYSRNHGCEGPGYTDFGRYAVRHDTLFLKGGLIDCAINVTGIDTVYNDDAVFRLKFIDQNNRDLTSRFKAYFKRPTGLYYTLAYDSVKSTLFYNNISNEKIFIQTLKMSGTRICEVNTFFPEGVTLYYHLQIPDLVEELNLLNQDILSEYQLNLQITPDSLVPLQNEYGGFDEPIFVRDN